MMKKHYFLILLVTMFYSCHRTNDETIAVIPSPEIMEPGNGHFVLRQGVKVLVDPQNDKVVRAASLFISDLRERQSLSLELEKSQKTAGKDVIILKLQKPVSEEQEGYRLDAGKRRIIITSSSPAGLFHGLMTIEQIALSSPADSGVVEIPAMKISDAPRFQWRGMHLDVGRHFMSVEEVKKYLDYMALYKFNTFHWHLTDDQGWRLEIKKYPELTRVGAWRDSTMIGDYSNKPVRYDGKRYGGFYTQEEAREIVQYAADRFITVVPEIEMPGHAQAAVASYPELGVTGRKVPVKTEWGVSRYIYMPSEKTFDFLEDVLTEVMDIFPSEYIHIGGDEARKDQWKNSPRVQALIAKLGLKDEDALQSYFIHRIEKFLHSKGRKIIGWDEILQGGLAPNATVMSWRGEKGGIAAARLGHDVIMSPTTYCYFDYYQAKPVSEEPLAIGGYLPLDSVYSYNPVPRALAPGEAKYILGVQANVWTEYIPDFRQVEYMIFPRMTAMSEVAWTMPRNKNVDDFHRRVNKQVNLFEKLGVNYSRSGMPAQGDSEDL